MTHSLLTSNLQKLADAALEKLNEPSTLGPEADWIDRAYAKATRLSLRDLQHCHEKNIRMHPAIAGSLIGPTDFSAVLRWLREYRPIGRDGATVNESFRISRAGWNGVGMYVKAEDLDTGTPYLTLFTARKEFQRGWLPSQADLFAEDWIVLYTPEIEGTPDVVEV